MTATTTRSDPAARTQTLGRIALIGLALAGILVPWIDLWHRVETAEVGLQPVPVATTRAKPVAPPGSRPVARGGSLLAASWALYRGRWRVAPHPVLFFLPRLLWHLRAPAGGAAAAVVCTMAAHLAGWHSALFLWMAGLLLVVGVPFHFDLPESRRLHLLGADWAPVAHHNLAWAVALSVIPATAGACAAALLPIGTTIGWTGAICMVAGFTAIRTCIWVLDSSWDALPDGRPGCLLPLAGIAAIAAGYRFAPEATHVAFGAAVLAIGVFGLYREWRDPEAAGRRVEAAASDD